VPEPVYLDNNATTAPTPGVREAMRPYLEEAFGNPSSLHAAGRRAAQAVAEARAAVARLVGASPSEVVFTSGGTEADAAAVLGALEAAGERRRVVTSAVEHPAVRDLLHHLRKAGRIQLVEVGVGRDGRLDPARVAEAAKPDTALVTVMWANNETGLLHPVGEIAGACRERGIPFHTDAVQAAGRVVVDLREVPADLLSLSAHKLHGPKGVGALVVRRGARWKPWPVSGHQEGGRRGGTENVAGIAGFGAAAEEALAALEGEARVAELRDRFEAAVLAAVPGARRAAAAEPRLPNTATLLFPGKEGDGLLLRLDALGIRVSTGSACTAADLQPSHVLRALGHDAKLARSAVRVSLSRFTTEEEIDRAAAAVVKVATA